MKSSDRRKQIIQLLSKSDVPLSGKKLAEILGVSRQVIVQDMALLRAEGNGILSTIAGYVLEQTTTDEVSRVFKVHHTDQQVEEELTLILDFGGHVTDVFVSHKTYGTLSAKMNIRSRCDIENFMNDLATSKSSLLMNVTSGYHYHTVSAPSEMVLDLIQEKLAEKGFLAPLQDYEPVDFWS